MTDSPYKRACDAAGGMERLAVRIGKTKPTFSHYKQRFPEDVCPDVEFAVDGAVTCEEMRPDVRWVRIPDPTWPHPAGRPLIDHTKTRAATESATERAA